MKLNELKGAEYAAKVAELAPFMDELARDEAINTALKDMRTDSKSGMPVFGSFGKAAAALIQPVLVDHRGAANKLVAASLGITEAEADGMGKEFLDAFASVWSEDFKPFFTLALSLA